MLYLLVRKEGELWRVGLTGDIAQLKRERADAQHAGLLAFIVAESELPQFVKQ